MANDSQDKKHLASSKRIAELRKKGTVLRSRDLSGGLVFITTIVMLFYMSSDFSGTLKDNFMAAFGSIKIVMNDQNALALVTARIAHNTFKIILPIYLVVLLITILSPFLFGGWNFTLDAIQFKLTKLNPVNNLGSIFSIKKVAVDILRSFLKAMFILGTLIYFVISRKNEIIALAKGSFYSASSSAYGIIEGFIIVLTFILLFLIAFDMLYHYFTFQSQSKMSSQELKDEHKEAEGSPEAKQKMRSKQFALIRQRLTVTVPKADVIITNPTHYAIALKYDRDNDRAPRVVAKGKDTIAQHIRQLAISNSVPIYEAPPLARALYHTTKVNKEINPGLYMAVAIVLSYVNQLKNYQNGAGQAPKYVNDLEIPNEFIYQD